MLGAFLLTITGAARAVVYPCTESGLDAALAAGGVATFDCAAKTTIVVSQSKSISRSGTNLDGGGRLVLSGDDVRQPLVVGAGVTATVSNITLERGRSTTYGGNLVVQGTLTLENSTVRDGFARIGGGGIYVAGGASLTANGCTLSGITGGNEGALSVHGSATLRNTTIADVSQHGVVVRGAATIDHCTVVTPAQPILLVAAFDGVTVGHSILFSSGGSPSISGSGAVVSNGYNMLSNPNGGPALGGDSASNLLGVTPLLGPLADNGGPTQTRALLACSPGINAGATTGGGSFDQRGQARLRNGARDIGAYESDLTPCLTIGDASANEGNLGATSLVFPVTLSGRSTMPVSVAYTFADGTASFADGDYAAAGGTLTLPPGTTSSSVNFLVLGDQRFEPDETVHVNLSNPVGGSLIDGTATGTILNDDTRPALAIGDITIVEGTGGITHAELTVSLSAASSETITVRFETANGSAVAGDDFLATSGTLTFTPGTVSRTIAVAVTGDSLFEGDESFTVDLPMATNATISRRTASVTIRDDETSPGIAIGSAAIDEGNAGTKAVSLTVTLTNGSATPVSVEWSTADGTATVADGDYASASGVLTFAPGETSKNIQVEVSADTRHEPTETVLVRLANASGARIASAEGTLTIGNDDPVPSISVAAPAAIVEGHAGDVDAVFVVSLSNPSVETVTVQYATSDGTATTGDGDYTATTGTLTFMPGETEHTVTVLVRGDLRFEPNETFDLTAIAPTNATLGAAQATATITNDDTAPIPDAGSTPDAAAGGDGGAVDAGRNDDTDAGSGAPIDPEMDGGASIVDAPAGEAGGCAVGPGGTAHRGLLSAVAACALVVGAIRRRRASRRR